MNRWDRINAACTGAALLGVALGIAAKSWLAGIGWVAGLVGVVLVLVAISPEETP